MGAITSDQTEWAVVDRLRQMLAAPQGEFTTTQAFALFSSIVCWVMQHIRVNPEHRHTATDKSAAELCRLLELERASDDPWCIISGTAGRIERHGLKVPAPVGFEHHSAVRMLKNLRDAMAHSDARTVQPFNQGHLLVGFTFLCSEKSRQKQVEWEGRVILLESDMQRIGCELAARYCGAIEVANKSPEGSSFSDVAASITEAAA